MLRIDTLKDKIYDLFFDCSRLVVNRKSYTRSARVRYFVVHTVQSSVRFDAVFMDVLEAENYIYEHRDVHPDYNYQILVSQIVLVQLPLNS